ncbi:hypothetical protein U1Q18_011375, partial [Sarracenia purpurea var. burkii]
TGEIHECLLLKILERYVEERPLATPIQPLSGSEIADKTLALPDGPFAPSLNRSSDPSDLTHFSLY